MRPEFTIYFRRKRMKKYSVRSACFSLVTCLILIVAATAYGVSVFPGRIQKAIDNAQVSEKKVTDAIDRLEDNQKRLEACLENCTGKELIKRILAERFQLQLEVPKISNFCGPNPPHSNTPTTGMW